MPVLIKLDDEEFKKLFEEFQKVQRITDPRQVEVDYRMADELGFMSAPHIKFVRKSGKYGNA